MPIPIPLLFPRIPLHPRVFSPCLSHVIHAPGHKDANPHVYGCDAASGSNAYSKSSRGRRARATESLVLRPDYSTVKRGAHESANSVTSFRESPNLSPNPTSSLFSPISSSSSSISSCSAVSHLCVSSLGLHRSRVYPLRPLYTTCVCSLPPLRRATRVLTPRRMSGVMNFNSFTPRHVGVEGRARGWQGVTGTGKNGDEFFARQIVDRLD